MKNRSECSAWNVDDSTAIEYLEEVLSVLTQFSWIYKTRNTDIFIYDVLKKIPSEWNEALSPLCAEDLHLVKFGLLKEDWPVSLKSFVTQCLHLAKSRFPSRNLRDLREVADSPLDKTTKVSSKKLYEIQVMSHLVKEVCEDSKCNMVLDIGSGLGYLDQILHHRHGLQCIGLDLSPKYTVAAKQRLKDDTCKNSIKHITMEVEYSEKCLKNLKSILNDEVDFHCSCNSQEKLSGDAHPLKVMVGLHSCGNLTQDMMRLFCEMEEISAFVCVGCCYNKIRLDDFPMSKAGQTVLSKSACTLTDWSPCASGLRLAAHGTRTHSYESTREFKNMFYRSLFQKYLHQENISWSQPKRHIRTSDLTSFETYCQVMLKHHPLENDRKTLENLTELHDKKMHVFPRIKVLLVLQTLLQPLWEGLVTVDRMLFFREKNLSTQVLALWDDSISSRNLALCAYKR